MGMIDAETLESFREIQADDKKFIRNYFDAFLSEFPLRLAAMNKSFKAGDLQKLAIDAHALKSSCANSGVSSLMELCYDIENKGLAGITDGVAAGLLEVDRLYHILEAEIKALPEYSQS